MIFLLVITNLIAIGYVERYCEVNQQQRDNAMLYEYLLKLTNEAGGDLNKLKNLYPGLVTKENKVIIHKSAVFRNPHYTNNYRKTGIKFSGFEFVIANNKIISSGFYQP